MQHNTELVLLGSKKKIFALMTRSFGQFTPILKLRLLENWSAIQIFPPKLTGSHVGRFGVVSDAYETSNVYLEFISALSFVDCTPVAGDKYVKEHEKGRTVSSILPRCSCGHNELR